MSGYLTATSTEEKSWVHKIYKISVVTYMSKTYHYYRNSYFIRVQSRIENSIIGLRGSKDFHKTLLHNIILIGFIPNNANPSPIQTERVYNIVHYDL